MTIRNSEIDTYLQPDPGNEDQDDALRHGALSHDTVCPHVLHSGRRSLYCASEEPQQANSPIRVPVSLNHFLG